MFDVKFALLFTVEILHKYYSKEECPDFVIMPSQQTAQVLSGHSMVWKQYGNRLYVGIQTDGTVPVVMPGTDMQLTFFMQGTNPLFYNFTNAVAPANPNLFYFSNAGSNTGNSRNFLTKPIDNYSSGNNYAPGDLATAGGVVFAAIAANGTANPQGTNMPAYWRAIDSNQYVTYRDQAAPATPALATELKGRNIFGIIDIFNSSTLAAGYKLFDGTNSLLTPVYSIYFLNRATKWKYFLPGITGKSILDANTTPGAALYTFSPVAANIISDVPISLSDQPQQFKLVKTSAPGGTAQVIANPIPSASVNNITKNVNDPFLYSEIYLNY